MISGSNAKIINRADLNFLLFDWLELQDLLERKQFSEHTVETTQAFLDTSEHLAVECFLPHYKKSDQEEPRLTDEGVKVLPEVRDAIVEIAEAGFFSAPFSSELGGLQLPRVVFSACEGLFMAANIATSAFLMLTVGNARLISSFGTPAQIEAFAKPQIAGHTMGTMCLSETEAGSSLGDIKTLAKPDGEDPLGQRYRLTGNKMWISGGDHDVTKNIVHLVLAKCPGPNGKVMEGTKGISLFIVPKLLTGEKSGSQIANDVTVAGLNHKMGYRGISNCLLNFGEGKHKPFGEAGAVGYLVGEVGQGLPIMFQMMNEARIGVGLGAAMLGYRGYLLALQYAQERLQGRSFSAAEERGNKPVAIVEHPDVKRMLLAQKAYAEGALALTLYCARLVDDEMTLEDDEERQIASKILSLLTPIVKTWPSEWCLTANDLAIQVHGGYGYTRDFDVEQIYRDNRLNPIHEGTTGIQAIDLMGRKIIRDNCVSLAKLHNRVESTVDRARKSDGFSGLAEDLARAWGRIREVAEKLAALADPAQGLCNASYFQDAFGHAVLAWIWLDKACHCDAKLGRHEGAEAYYAGKIHTCRYFFECELPKIGTWLDVVDELSDVSSAMGVDQF